MEQRIEIIVKDADGKMYCHSLSHCIIICINISFFY